MNPVSITVKDDQAIVMIDNPPVNVLSQAVRDGLFKAIEKTDADDKVMAVILICAGRTFSVGADISEFDQPPQPPYLLDVIKRLEQANKPWFAAIHGSALGGGLEVALGCHYRLAAEDARLGFPEVNLGLIPGAGGSVRLPRLVGAKAALEMIANGKPIAARKALAYGLVDRITDKALLPAVLQFIDEIGSDCKRPALSACEIQPLQDKAAWQAQLTAIGKKARGQTAPLAAIEVVENSLALSAEEAQQQETAMFQKLKRGPQSVALRHIFFAERAAAKMPRLKGVQPRLVKQVGIVGGGTMGAGIAVACLLSGLEVILLERDNNSLDAGLSRVKTTLQKSHSRGLIDDAELAAMPAALVGTVDFAALADVDLVIEAVFEDMAIKKDVFVKLQAVTRPDAVLATNTSYLDITELAESLPNPSRVLGLHFFSPAYIMKLLEIIHPSRVADEVLATGFSLAKILGKIAVPAGVCDGFIGNRIMSAYRRECEYMLEDGALPQEIDVAMVNYGFPMGIFAMSDLAGLDIAWAMRKRQAVTRPPDLRYVDIADRLCEMGRLGRKTGLGWYDYSGNPAGKPDAIVEKLIVAESARKHISRRAFTEEKIIARILRVMQNEGHQIITEGVAENAAAIDVVMINGYGFPRWRGGPMFAGDTK